MQITDAVFRLQDKRLGELTVYFLGDEVTVTRGDQKAITLDNAKRRYKPCATHAMDAVRRAFPAEPKTNFERSRRDEVPVALKVFSEQSTTPTGSSEDEWEE